MLYNGNKIETPRYVFELAREFRQGMTDSENHLWNFLKNKQVDGFKFRCQHPVFRYILDFYCHEVMLAVEVDGDVHKSRQDYDEYRDTFLQGIGIKTIRFSAKVVEDNVSQVVHTIHKELINRSKP